MDYNEIKLGVAIGHYKDHHACSEYSLKLSFDSVYV